jgi:hypothetical protein
LVFVGEKNRPVAGTGPFVGQRLARDGANKWASEHSGWTIGSRVRSLTRRPPESGKTNGGISSCRQEFVPSFVPPFVLPLFSGQR